MRKTGVLSILLLALLSSLIAGCAEKATEPPLTLHYNPWYMDVLLSFAVIGDRTGNEQPGIYARTIEQVQRYYPDLALTVGDMIEGYTSDTVLIKRQWEEYLDLVEPLTMPTYFTAGNHDIWDVVSRGFYERYIGEPCYSFTVDSIHFVFLDNGMCPGIQDFPEEQITWLRNDLEANRDPLYTFVFMHIPYWVNTVARGNPDILHTIFVKYGVSAVFNGHLHSYRYGRYNGVTYVGVGSSGAEPRGDRDFHFIDVTVRPHKFSFAVVHVGSEVPNGPGYLNRPVTAESGVSSVPAPSGD
jgi:hypothetical protein